MLDRNKKIDLRTLINSNRKKIAWGITGGGHQLHESILKIEEMLKSGYSVDIFFSRAGKEVCKMFGEFSGLNKLQNKYPESMKFIFSENQEWSFPICGSFSLKAYDVLIVSPSTGNTVAKLTYKIADTLITNIVSQSLKGGIPVIVIPTDFKIGPCETVAPGNKKITIEIHESDVERTKALQNMNGVIVIESPSKIIID